MHYACSQHLEPTGYECVVLGFFSGDSLPSMQDTDKALLTSLQDKLTLPMQWLWQADLSGKSFMLVHCGTSAEYNSLTLGKTLGLITQTLLDKNIKTAQIQLPLVASKNADWQLMQMLLKVDALCFPLDSFKSQNKKAYTLQTVNFCLPDASNETLITAQAIAAGITLTRRLADLPANHCTPATLAKQALQLAEQHATVQTKILEKAALQKLGLGALLAVGQGSNEPPCLIELTYKGTSDKAPVVLVGKGITFDSGGISLKPALGMEEMKYDMAGAASVLGVIHACAVLKLPIHIVGLLPAAENMPGGAAIKPGDVITSLSGQTIEIVNTDAEGRLILADALTYAERFDPQFVIDIATLTGAVITALGYINTGFMTKDEALAEAIEHASLESNDTVWRLPLQDAYQEALESPQADLVNATADRSAGSVTAACFLSRFTKKYRWAHLDIAGTAWISGKNRQATGRPVSLLVTLLRHVANTR